MGHLRLQLCHALLVELGRLHFTGQAHICLDVFGFRDFCLAYRWGALPFILVLWMQVCAIHRSQADCWLRILQDEYGYVIGRALVIFSLFLMLSANSSILRL